MSAFASKFTELTAQTIDEQAAFFSKRFVFALGDGYSDVVGLAKEFKIALEADSSSANGSLSAAGAANFLQVHGKTRTALQRSAEIKDIDINNDKMISFIEYLLLHYKVMILVEHFQRLDTEPNVDLSNDGVGLSGVGSMLVEELYQPPAGLDPELERMMRDFTMEHSKREAKIGALTAKVEAGGVKGMAAKNELEQLKLEDESEMHAVEAKIAAAIKKAQKAAGKELAAKEKGAKDADKAKLAEGRSKMAEKMAMFNK